MARRDRFDTSERTIVTPQKALTIPPSTTRVAYLIVIHGDDLGKRIEVGSGVVEAGRAPECAIAVNHESVSRRHAQFWWNGSTYRVRDLGSTNGTHVNDTRVTEQALADGDRVKVGPTILKFMSGANIEALYHEKVYRMTTLDGLTRIYNKRYFHETLRLLRRRREYPAFARAMARSRHRSMAAGSVVVRRYPVWCQRGDDLLVSRVGD